MPTVLRKWNCIPQKVSENGIYLQIIAIVTKSVVPIYRQTQVLKSTVVITYNCSTHVLLRGLVAIKPT